MFYGYRLLNLAGSVVRQTLKNQDAENPYGMVVRPRKARILETELGTAMVIEYLWEVNPQYQQEFVWIDPVAVPVSKDSPPILKETVSLVNNLTGAIACKHHSVYREVPDLGVLLFNAREWLEVTQEAGHSRLLRLMRELVGDKYEALGAELCGERNP